MTRQALAGFIVINIVVSLVVVVGIIAIWDYTQEDDEPIIRRPPESSNLTPVMNSNPGGLPAEGYVGTIGALEITSEAQARRILTLEAGAEAAGQSYPTETPFVNPPVVDSDVPTLDPSVFPRLTLPVNPPGDAGAATQVPDDGCQRYVIQVGDTCSAIAEGFNVDTNELIVLNDIDPNCQGLIPGEELRIPGPNCQPPPTVTPTPTITRTPFIIGTFVATNTPAPTAVSADVRIVEVANPGNVRQEQVQIRNFSEAAVNLRDWTLSDAQGNTFTLPNALIQPEQSVIIYTRVGQNTPAAFYWNQTVAIWQIGDVARLADAGGTIQSEYTIQGE